MEKVTDEYGSAMYSDVDHDCVFNLVLSLNEEYTIYHLNFETYLHYLYYDSSTFWYISHQPSKNTVKEFFKQVDVDMSKFDETLITVNKLNLCL